MMPEIDFKVIDYIRKTKKHFSTLRDKGGAIITDPPNSDYIQKWWGGIFGDKAKYNKEPDWLENDRKGMKNVEVTMWTDI